MKLKRYFAVWLCLGCLSLGISGAASAISASAESNPLESRARQAAPADKVINFSKKVLAVPAGSVPYSCPYCDLRNANLADANLSNANLHGADLSGANLSGATLTGTELADANLTGANLNNAVMTPTSNGGTDLSSANLSGATLVGANLAGADLEYSELSGADFSNADLSSTRMDPAPRTGLHSGRKTNFTEAKLPGGLLLDEASSVLTEAQVQRHTPAVKPSTLEYSCGSSDLSGLTKAVYVATAGNDSPTCGGTVASACKTVSQGIANCTAGSCGVLVGYGQYVQTISLALRDGVNVYGGCVAATQPSTGLLSFIQAPVGGAPAVTASSISATTAVQNLKILATAATTNGSSSIALQVSNSPGLQITNSEIYAAQGAVGANGTSPGAAGVGGAGSEQSAGTNGKCSNSNGGKGAGVMAVSVDNGAFSFTCKPSCSSDNCWGQNGSPGSTSSWSRGGQWGNGDCAECPSGSGGDKGNSGAAGATAYCGSKGIASVDTKGAFSGPNWVASLAGSGTQGGDGGGGGGGGSGGYHAGSCFWVKTEENGNAGGGGGAGGCGGGGGSGAQQGGASFAVVNVGGALTINTSRIIGGLSGKGGTGAAGVTGGTGGAASANGNQGSSDAGAGGTGGVGGGGGGGGGGAGGNAGPALNVALVSGGSLNGSGQVYYLGASGTPGSGGAGADSGAPSAGTNGACTAPTGDKGIPGLVANQEAF